MIESLEISLIKHSEVSDNYIEKIISLKTLHWPYSFESQKEWINNNIQPDDYHLCLETKNRSLIGYLNLVFLQGVFGHIEKKIIGVGNVCVDKQISGKGFGVLLMQIANYYITTFGLPGMLLCSESLVMFYKKVNWVEFQGEIFINGSLFGRKSFFTQEIKDKTVKIDRSF